jgi:hypothetical protein
MDRDGRGQIMSFVLHTKIQSFTKTALGKDKDEQLLKKGAFYAFLFGAIGYVLLFV